MRTPEGVQLVVWLKRLGVMALAALAIVGWSLAVSRDQTVHDLTTKQNQSRPLTDYNTAYFAHLDCELAYTIRFNANIADALVSDPGMAREAAVAKLKVDRDALRAIVATLCPTPSPPTFKLDGKLDQPPVIRPQTLPPPGD